jgi:GGDEF domain-containing protein
LIDSNLENSEKIALKIKDSIENSIPLREIGGKSVTASFGLTISKNDDNAMYKSKHTGKNRVTVM